MRGSRHNPNPETVCIGCYCTDTAACMDEFSNGCTWVRRDVKIGLGVCSSCPGHAGRWDKGDRALAPHLQIPVSLDARGDFDAVLAELEWEYRRRMRQWSLIVTRGEISSGEMLQAVDPEHLGVLLAAIKQYRQFLRIPATAHTITKNQEAQC